MPEENKAFQFDEKLAGQLNRLFQTDSVRKLRKSYLDLLSVQPGEHVLDVGCGTGANSIALVESLQGNCRVTGIDNSEPMLAIGRENLRKHPFGDRIVLQPGDAHRLSFGDGDFDSAMIIQVLEYSIDPIALLKEIRRVLKDRAKIFVADTDWDTIVWNSTQKEITRRIVSQWSDHEADGWQGRKIVEYLKRTGFMNIHGGIFTIAETSFEPGGYAHTVTEVVTDYLERSGKMKRKVLEEWIADLKEQDRNGYFYFSLNRYAFVAEKNPEH
jgi:arsenite methyltransferase